MILKNKNIKIKDWTGRELFIGPYDSKGVDEVLCANWCECRYWIELEHEVNVCEDCDDTGYSGDFEVMWVDESDKDDCNVYEYINY